MLHEHKQVDIPEQSLHEGLSGTDVPGEPVAYVKLAPEALARRFALTFQKSFDNLDDVEIALLDLSGGSRIALVHHAGFPENETEVYADRGEWKCRDIVPEVLKALELSESALSWRQTWPHSLFDAGPAR